MIKRVLRLLFPPKCVLCKKLLTSQETDLCSHCRIHAPEFPGAKITLSFVAQWTGIWYYKDDVRGSLLRYKFGGRRSYAPAYGRFLAMKLQRMGWDDADCITWIPISARRRFRRGFDQSELIARVVAAELGLPLVAAAKKIRHTKPQSLMGDAAHRRANILGAYRVTDPAHITGKRVLLIDDIITTGATASECARVLLTAGAKEVKLATVAVATHDTR